MPLPRIGSCRYPGAVALIPSCGEASSVAPHPKVILVIPRFRDPRKKAGPAHAGDTFGHNCPQPGAKNMGETHIVRISSAQFGIPGFHRPNYQFKYLYYL